MVDVMNGPRCNFNQNPPLVLSMIYRGYFGSQDKGGGVKAALFHWPVVLVLYRGVVKRCPRWFFYSIPRNAIDTIAGVAVQKQSSQ
jgi:hypothetical protein